MKMRASAPSARGLPVHQRSTNGEDPTRKTTDPSLPRSLLAQATRNMGRRQTSTKLLCGKFASTSPPTLITHGNVATAITNQCRSARLGSVILV